MTGFRLPARPELLVQHCTPLLMDCMERCVIEKRHDALREFHQMGIPLDFALDIAVKKGNLPTTEFVLNLGVQPSEQTLLMAMRRGQTFRNMFLDRVKPNTRHLNAAVLAEHYDTVGHLIDRFGIRPNHSSVTMMKDGAASSERSAYVDRLISLLSDEDIRREEVMKHLAGVSTPAQYERAVERLGLLPQRSKKQLLSDCLRAAAPALARVMINQGAIFERDHLDIVGEGLWRKCHGNPNGEWGPVFETVLHVAIEAGVLYQKSDEVESVARLLITRYPYHRNEIQPLLDRLSLLANASRPTIRPYVGRMSIATVEMRRLHPRTPPEDAARLQVVREHVRRAYQVDVSMVDMIDPPTHSPVMG